MALQQAVTVDGVRQSRDGIERALDVHVRGGRIEFWTRAMRPHQDGHRIGLNDGTVLVARSLRETALAVLVLASAARAAGQPGTETGAGR